MLAFVAFLVATPVPGPALLATQSAFEEGEALLRIAEATDLFINESEAEPGAILLRHKASGFVCVINSGRALNAVTVFPSAVRGDDVGCTTETITDIRTLYLTRTDIPLARLADSAASAIRAEYRNAQSVNLRRSPPMFSIPGLAVPPHVSFGFETAESYEQVTVGTVRGWAIKYRFSAPPGRSGISGVLESFWTTTAVLEPELAARRAARAEASSVSATPAVQPKSATVD